VEDLREERIGTDWVRPSQARHLHRHEVSLVDARVSLEVNISRRDSDFESERL
jgi:hypothetical protein